MQLLFNRLKYTNLIRRNFSIPPNIVSNYVKFEMINDKINDLVDFLNKNEIKYKNVDEKNKENTTLGVFLKNLEQFQKVFETSKYKANFQSYSSDDGNILLKNRISIKFEHHLDENTKSYIRNIPFASVNLHGNRFYQIYCENEEQFNSLFFLNGNISNELIERSFFPYIKDFTLKISPNILNVYFPHEIINEEKASSFFKDLKFNKITKPYNKNGPWKFYLSNETDYLKMLSKPYFYYDKCLLILPYYGSTGLLYNGEKKMGNFVYIYSKNTLEKSKFPSTFLSLTQTKYENGYLTTIYNPNMSDLNALRFLNGSKQISSADYTMILGDKINESNLISPYLILRKPLDYDPTDIIAQITPFIYKHRIFKSLKYQFLTFLPFSFEDYQKLLELSSSGGDRLLRLYPSTTPRFLYLSNCVRVTKEFYQSNKDEITKSFKCRKIIESDNKVFIYLDSSEICNALFQLARYDDALNLIFRASHQMLRPNSSVSSHRAFACFGKNLKESNINLVNSSHLQSQFNNEDFSILCCKKVEFSFPYLFNQSIELNDFNYLLFPYINLYREVSKLIYKCNPELIARVLDFHGVKWSYNKTRNSGEIILILENHNDLINIISIADSFENEKEVTFYPGKELKQL